MATIEFIIKRIDGAKKNVEKLEKKLERINKAKATNWEVNPYYYSESDLKWTARDLEDAKKSLAKYEADLVTANEKASSRNVPAITEFINAWYDKMVNLYQTSYPKFVGARNTYWKEDKDIREKMDAWRWKTSLEYRKSDAGKAEYRELDIERRSNEQQFREVWGWIIPYVDHNGLDEVRVKKDLKAEADRKYDFIIERTNTIVGQITDATNLYVGDKGDLNGFIIGTRGTAKVQTIGAGGYNIQCFHFRTLINPMKR